MSNKNKEPTTFDLACEILEDGITSGEADLFFDQNQMPYATFDGQTWQVEGEKLYEWVAVRLDEEHGKMLPLGRRPPLDPATLDRRGPRPAARHRERPSRLSYEPDRVAP